MTVHSDQSAIEFQQLRQDADDATRRNQILKSDNEKLHKEAADLSKQVQSLAGIIDLPLFNCLAVLSVDLLYVRYVRSQTYRRLTLTIIKH